MNLLILFFILNFNYIYSEIHCRYRHLQMNLQWPDTLFMNFDADYARFHGFIITSVEPIDPEPGTHSHRGRCNKFDFNYFTDSPIATGYWPQVFNPGDDQPDHESVWRANWERNGLCSKSTRTLFDPSEYFDFFLNRVIEFNTNIFRNALHLGICQTREYRRNLTPGFYVCDLSDLRFLIENVYPTRVNLRCKSGTLVYQNPEDPTYDYGILRSYILNQVKICYDRYGQLVDCDPMDTCPDEDTKNIYFPRRYHHHRLLNVTDDDDFLPIEINIRKVY